MNFKSTLTNLFLVTLTTTLLASSVLSSQAQAAPLFSSGPFRPFDPPDGGVVDPGPVQPTPVVPLASGFDLLPLENVTFTDRKLIVPVKNVGTSRGNSGATTSVIIDELVFPGTLWVRLENGHVSRQHSFPSGAFGFIEVYDPYFADFGRCERFELTIESNQQTGSAVLNDTVQAVAKQAYTGLPLCGDPFQRPDFPEQPQYVAELPIPREGAVVQMGDLSRLPICEQLNGELDRDCDNIPDWLDRCPLVVQTDPTQKDTNRDGIPDECQCGDPNGSGRLEAEDLLMTYQCLRNDPAGEGVCRGFLARGDANGTGRFESDDLHLIYRAQKGEPVTLRCPASMPMPPLN